MTNECQKKSEDSAAQRTVIFQPWFVFRSEIWGVTESSRDVSAAGCVSSLLARAIV
jgi:hypothetical protein